MADAGPSQLPYDPPLRYDALLALLSEADRELARLDAATEFLPNPDLFVKMYVRKEAVLSSQIEGTQSTLSDLLQFEAEAAEGKPIDNTSFMMPRLTSRMANRSSSIERYSTLLSPNDTRFSPRAKAASSASSCSLDKFLFPDPFHVKFEIGRLVANMEPLQSKMSPR